MEFEGQQRNPLRRQTQNFGGEGCVLLVLKRLADATAARDRIIAVLAGTAVNHGGASGGFSVPNPRAQAAVISRALESASVDPSEIGFVESHGTGTSLGDPIEVRALADALNAGVGGRKPIWLGAVKSNFGHSESAAGAVSLLKAALSVHYEVVPPNLHCATPNAAVEWSELPFRLPRAASPWIEGYERRIAGVSSFGMSGTNAHVIVTEPPVSSTGQPKVPAGCVLPISARSRGALIQMAERYREFLRSGEVP
jgi:acyl transferase domain-containing protein